MRLCESLDDTDILNATDMLNVAEMQVDVRERERESEREREARSDLKSREEAARRRERVLGAREQAVGVREALVAAMSADVQPVQVSFRERAREEIERGMWAGLGVGKGRKDSACALSPDSALCKLILIDRCLSPTT